jgi:hypothetical protein
MTPSSDTPPSAKASQADRELADILDALREDIEVEQDSFSEADGEVREPKALARIALYEKTIARLEAVAHTAQATAELRALLVKKDEALASLRDKGILLGDCKGRPSAALTPASASDEGRGK